MTADVTLILEGTYPYVAGGVSTWVHQIIGAYPDRQFSLLHIGPHPGAYTKPLFTMPSNVAELHEVHCRGAEQVGRRVNPRLERSRRGAPSRVLAAIRRLHLTDVVDDSMIADLAAGDLTMSEFLHGEETFELLRGELYEKHSPGAPFMDFFWHFRSMHIPLLRLLAGGCPKANIYHAVSTGYAGVVGAVESYKTGKPLVVTEHGIYAREREMELSRATWIKDDDSRKSMKCQQVSPLRRFWSHYFRMLSKIAYHQATRLVTLSEANRMKQLADGASSAKITVVPNGVKGAALALPAAEVVEEKRTKMRVGFVGRVVPIKDVITLVRAVSLAKEQVEMEVWIIGPQDEDAAYAQRCRTLVDTLGLQETIKFLGPQPVAEIYPKLDVVLLTSLSEGQPLVMLEAYANAVPCIATDVGACRELIEGGNTADCALGPSGIVTRVANPTATAAALVKLARDPELRVRMGKAGLARVTARYQLHQVVASYEHLYASMAS